MPYYGLYIPVKGGEPSLISNGANTTNSNNLADSAIDVNKEIGDTDVSKYVFQNKKEALKVLRDHKDARFKEFLTEDEAIKYAQTGFEVVQNKYNDAKTSRDNLEKAQFRAPLRGQLYQFRHNIESDDWIIVQKVIWENPRYLVSSGDTPTILKESFRYNAMHICAINGSCKVAQLILNTVSDPKFAELLIGKKSDEKSCKQLCATLLDYYLNLAEKGRSETPLHLASKYGHPGIVKLLLSYPECKLLRNVDGLLAQTIACARNSRVVKYDVLKYFQDNYYVPVLRSKDTAVLPQVGEPFVANNPPNSHCDPLTPELEIKALAGPMSEYSAKNFFRRWKTPPRLRSSPNNSFISLMKPHNITPIKKSHGLNSSLNSPTATFQRRSLFNSTPNRHDHNFASISNGFDKSIPDDSFDSKHNGVQEMAANDNECLNKEETNNNNHMNDLPKYQFKFKNKQFSNYRDTNNASPIVGSIELDSNDSLLNVSDIYDIQCFKERHIKNTDAEKGLECIGRILAKENNIDWCEYWDFLEGFVDIASEKGIQKLENYLEKRIKEQNQHKNKSKSSQNTDLIDVCNALENAFRIPAASNFNASVTHQSTTPYTYVEKSLQVHAKRMTKTIIHNIDNEMAIVYALILELRRVKSLIYSFKEDISYVKVNFEKVHSRIGNLISVFLENSQEVSKEMKLKILDVLQNISIEESERREHMECVCSRIVEMLQNPKEQILPENVKTEEMCSKIWSQEKACNCQWESNLRRKTSRHNRMSAFNYKIQQRLKQQEDLQKDVDNQQKVNNEDCHNKTDDAKDSSDEDPFWSDFGDSDSDDEVFFTPCGSPPNDTYDDSNRLFIYGDEPTKRDLDVLNAIFHISIDKTKYPNIHSWKSSIMRYTNEEMDLFPSPRIVKKSLSFMATSSNKNDLFVHPQTPTSVHRSHSIRLTSPRPQSPLATATTASSSSNAGILKEPTLQKPTSKYLFMSPVRTKSMTAISLEPNVNANDSANYSATEDIQNKAATTRVNHKLQLQPHTFLTPLNKPKGLFSIYRELPDGSPQDDCLGDLV